MTSCLNILSLYFLQIKETQHSVRDSESGLHRMAIGHHLGKVVILSILDNLVSVISVLVM